MSKRGHGKTTPIKQRSCLRCHSPMASNNPVWLVASSTGSIMGPFHAGCAERLKLQAEKMGFVSAAEKWEQLGNWPSRREETLPE